MNIPSVSAVMFAPLMFFATCGGPIDTTHPDPKQPHVSYVSPTAHPNGLGNVYEYAPSTFDHNGLEWEFTCSAAGNGVIEDDIRVQLTSLSTGVLFFDGITFSRDPDPTAWDSTHVCDPTVVEGDFGVYNFAMFYTGAQFNLSSAAGANSVGVAYSVDMNSWTRVLDHPLVAADHAPGEWGTGQPTATKVGPSTVLLGYTKSNAESDLILSYVDLSDPYNPIMGTEWKMTESGLKWSVTSNSDIAYDPQTDRFYVLAATRLAPQGDPQWLPDEIELAWLPGSDFWSGTGSWTHVAYINKAVTGRDRNHNGSIHKNTFGMVPDSSEIRVNFTASEMGPFPGGLWTYRVYSTNVTIPS